MGIMARHIAYHGEHPIYFYGQHYMGALEAYFAAVLVLLSTGSSGILLREMYATGGSTQTLVFGSLSYVALDDLQSRQASSYA